MGDTWVDTMSAGVLTIVWLRGKIHAGEWCYEDVGSCEVKKVARFGFLLPRSLIKTCMRVYVCVRVRVCVHEKLKNYQQKLTQLDTTTYYGEP